MKVGILATLFAGLLMVGFPLTSAGGPAPDTDGDGVPDVIDNCLLVPNASPLDCDGDNDGYGNVCDADIDNSGGQNSNDLGPFVAALQAVPPDLVADIDCSGAANSNDISPFVGLLGASAVPGPSGLSCAGAPPCPPGP